MSKSMKTAPSGSRLLYPRSLPTVETKPLPHNGHSGPFSIPSVLLRQGLRSDVALSIVGIGAPQNGDCTLLRSEGSADLRRWDDLCRSLLTQRGYCFTPASGQFGNVEPCVLVWYDLRDVINGTNSHDENWINTRFAEIDELAAHIGQLSVLHRTGDWNVLKWLAGEHAGRFNVGRGVQLLNSFQDRSSRVYHDSKGYETTFRCRIDESRFFRHAWGPYVDFHYGMDTVAISGFQTRGTRCR